MICVASLKFPISSVFCFYRWIDRIEIIEYARMSKKIHLLETDEDRSEIVMTEIC
jgi:hypothetical protein